MKFFRSMNKQQCGKSITGVVSPPYQYMQNTRAMYCSFDKMLTTARESGEVDWHKIVDNTRRTIAPNKPDSSVDDFMDTFRFNIDRWHERYTVDLWANQSCRIKVFVEKEALAGIISAVAMEYRVATIPGRGYNSVTQLMNQAEDLRNLDK